MIKYLLFLLLILNNNALYAQDTLTYTYKEADSILSTYIRSKAYDNGISLCQELSKRSATKDSLYGEYIEYMGYFYQLKRDYPAALAAYQEAADVFATVLGDTSLRYANTKGIIGTLYYFKGEYKKAIPLFTAAGRGL